MRHIYVVVATPYIEEAILKGRTDYEQPQYNRSVRYSLDGQKVLIEGLFCLDDYVWFEQYAECTGDIEEIKQYITDHLSEWQTELIE